MTRYVLSHRWQFIALSLIALLALLLLLFAQAPALTDLPFQRQAPVREAVSGATTVDPMSGVHPADRKFFTNRYEGRSSANAYMRAGVHPADRKFFTPGYGVSGSTLGSTPAEPPAHIHPADRKFYDAGHIWIPPAGPD